MSSKSILLITGGNTGLGLETVKQLFQSSNSYHVLIGGRSLDKAKAAVESLEKEFPQSSSSAEPIQVDIEDDASIEKAFETVKSKFGKLDTLVNNAGAGFDGEIASGSMSVRDAWNKGYNVNTTSTHIMTSTFVPLLIASSSPRLVFITSGTSTLTTVSNSIASGGGLNQTIPPAGWPKPKGLSFISYQSSKTGMNMMMLNWVRTLKNDGVKVLTVSPGFLATGLGGTGKEQLLKFGAMPVEVGAKFTASVIEGSRDADAGKIVNSSGIQPW